MLRRSTTVRNDGPALLAALACALVAFCPVPGRADVALYQAVVPLQGSAEADRQAAFAAALRGVAVRVSGQRDAAENAVIAKAAADPAKYVQQYGRTADRMLKVGFEPQSLDALLGRAGLPLWPAERPPTLILLAMPGPSGAIRVLVEGDSGPERAALERAADYRGLPLLWPRAGIDVERVRAQLMSGEAGAVAAEAGAERAQAVLLGTRSGADLDWVFAHAGRPARRRGSLQDGVDLAADSLASLYAPASTRSLSTVSIEIGGVSDVRTYAALLAYLQSLSLVRRVAVEELAGATVRLEVTMRGDLDQLRRVAALDGHLRPAPDVDFQYLP